MPAAWQVASHAQKYFIRLNSLNKKDKRRSSIHDITHPGGPSNGDITGALHCPALAPTCLVQLEDAFLEAGNRQSCNVPQHA